MVKIAKVNKNSIAEKHKILPGDVIVSINGNDINDVLDYRFYITEKKLIIVLERRGEPIEITVKKPQYDDLGLDFDTYLMDEKHSCKNKCVFCFIDQNPPGMREQCYFKDDDSRMSFFYGNYVTLTNMKREEVDRLVKMRISPINISVHTTNPELRCKMMNNRFAGQSLEYLKVFKDGGIYMNCQIVLCKGLNDGKELERTLDDLSEYFPYVESIAVVPSGLTKYRDGLYPLEPFGKQDARDVIALVDRKRNEFMEKFGMYFVQCSDEWYLTAEMDLPGEDYYDGYPQLDNGVGLIRNQCEETEMRIEELKDEGFVLENKRVVSSVTGVSAYDSISKMGKLLEENFDGLEYHVYRAVNNFFGHTITVSGLLTGQDLYEQLKDKELGQELIIPDVMLRYEKDLFLDNMSVDELSEKLGVKIVPVRPGGDAFVDAVLGIYE